MARQEQHHGKKPREKQFIFRVTAQTQWLILRTLPSQVCEGFACEELPIVHRTTFLTKHLSQANDY